MAKQREVQELNHLISAGNINFPSVPAKGTHATVQVFYKGLDTSDVSISIEQSTGTNEFGVITGVAKSLNNGLKSHTFNIIGLATDLIRPVLDIGTATTGEIIKVIYIFE